MTNPHEKCCRTWGSNPRPSAYQAHRLPRPACFISVPSHKTQTEKSYRLIYHKNKTSPMTNTVAKARRTNAYMYVSDRMGISDRTRNVRTVWVYTCTVRPYAYALCPFLSKSRSDAAYTWKQCKSKGNHTVLFKLTFCEVRQICLVFFSNIIVLKEVLYRTSDSACTCTIRLLVHRAGHRAFGLSVCPSVCRPG